MANKLVISSFAHEEEVEAYEWYELQRAGLGDEFLLELEFAYLKISNNPLYFSFIDENKKLRDFLLPRFPFVIVFIVRNDFIEVIAVHHCKKHPSKKYGRRL